MQEKGIKLLRSFTDTIDFRTHDNCPYGNRENKDQNKPASSYKISHLARSSGSQFGKL